jgi:hypothetical protein
MEPENREQFFFFWEGTTTGTHRTTHTTLTPHAHIHVCVLTHAKRYWKPLASIARETAVPLNAHACVPCSKEGGLGETGNKSRCDPFEPGRRHNWQPCALANAATSTFAREQFFLFAVRGCSVAPYCFFFRNNLDGHSAAQLNDT